MLECLISGKKILRKAPGRGMGVQGGGVAMFGEGHMASFYANKRTFCATLRHFHFHSLASLGHFLLPLFVGYTFVFAARLSALISVCVCVFAFLPLPNWELMENSNYNNFAPAAKKVFQPRRFSFLFTLPF